MNILTTDLTSQNLIFIPRSTVLSSLNLKVTSEDTNITVSYTVTAAYTNEQATIAQAFTLIEGTYYNYEVLNGTVLMYRGSIFCTDQVDYEKYVINNNDFVETAARDNEFVTP